MALIHFTDQNFDDQVLKSPHPVFVDFYAPWCGPCQQLGPIVEKLAQEYEGKDIVIGKVNIDENADIAEKYGILSIPTLLFFKNGEIVDQLRGMQSEVALKEKMNVIMG